MFIFINKDHHLPCDDVIDTCDDTVNCGCTVNDAADALFTSRPQSRWIFEVAAGVVKL